MLSLDAFPHLSDHKPLACVVNLTALGSARPTRFCPPFVPSLLPPITKAALAAFAAAEHTFDVSDLHDLVIASLASDDCSPRHIHNLCDALRAWQAQLFAAAATACGVTSEHHSTVHHRTRKQQRQYGQLTRRAATLTSAASVSRRAYPGWRHDPVFAAVASIFRTEPDLHLPPNTAPDTVVADWRARLLTAADREKSLARALCTINRTESRRRDAANLSARIRGKSSTKHAASSTNYFLLNRSTHCESCALTTAP